MRRNEDVPAWGGLGNDEGWVFAYGSLMWNADFPVVESLAARLHGYHRALCLTSVQYRGTPERPGLIFGLDNGGSCTGRVLRISKANQKNVYDHLMRREMVMGAYLPLNLTVRAGTKKLVALCFVADRNHPQYVGKLGLSEIADRVAGARGSKGGNAEYIINTSKKLASMGVPCPWLARVCAEIRQRNPSKP